MFRYILVLILCLLNSIAFADKFADIHVLLSPESDRDNFSNPEILYAKTKCMGKDNQYTVTDKFVFAPGTVFNIRVGGQFSGDHRNSCIKTDWKANPYFTIKELIVGFDYKQKHYICNINQDIGTSFYRNISSEAYDELHGDNENISLPCMGGAGNNFYYTLVPGKGNRGYIKIYNTQLETITVPPSERTDSEN